MRFINLSLIEIQAKKQSQRVPLRNGLFCLYASFGANGVKGPKKNQNRHRRRFQTKKRCEMTLFWLYSNRTKNVFLTFALQTGWAEKWTKTGIAEDFKPKQLRHGVFCLYLDKGQFEETVSSDGLFVANGLEGQKEDERQHRKRFQTQPAAKWLVLPVFG